MSGSNVYQVLKNSLKKSPYNYFYDLNQSIHKKIALNEINMYKLYNQLSIEETHTDLLLSI